MSAIPRPFTILGSNFGTNAVIPASNTNGLRIYNTADQVTNYQRLELLYSSNVAGIGTRTGGTIASTPLRLFAQTQNGNAGFVRFDLQADASPAFRFGTFTTATGIVDTAYTGTIFVSVSTVHNGTSGTNSILSITPTYNQSSGTASNTDLLINRIETAIGSGTQRLADFQVSGTSQFNVDRTGNITALGTAFVGSVKASSAGAIYWNSNSVFRSPANGIVTLSNFAESDFTRLQFGGTTSSFPSLKRNGTTLLCVKADDSAYATFDALAYLVGGNPGIDTTITSANLVGKTITVSKGIITGFV